MDYKKLAYEALQRVSVSTTWSEGAIQRVADYLETTLQNTSSNSENPLKKKYEKVKNTPEYKIIQLEHEIEWLNEKLSSKDADITAVCQGYLELLEEAKEDYNLRLPIESYFKHANKVAETAKKLMEEIG